MVDNGGPERYSYQIPISRDSEGVATLRTRAKVKAEQMARMPVGRVIRGKRNGLALLAEEIEAFVVAARKRTEPDYQEARRTMALNLRRVDAAKTAML